MLRELIIEGVGPVKRAEFDFAPRLNLITGDNGLGKSFVLETAWWALTRVWRHRPAWPGPGADAAITYTYDAKTRPHRKRVDHSADGWKLDRGRPPIPGMVLYADADGGFAVWDPARNYSKANDPDRPAAFVFDRDSVWRGLEEEGGRRLCNGLIEDWIFWQLDDGEPFAQLVAVLEALSEGEPVPPLEPGRPGRLPAPDATRYPTLRMPYGKEVPIVHASAGMRRIVALAYLLVWTWQEHQQACREQGLSPARRIILLIDELESHLHPRWQRRILPALLDVVQRLTGSNAVEVQLIGATHSPMVLASLEPSFDDTRDRIWTLDFEPGADAAPGEVVLRRFAWSPRGDVNGWLTSELFDLRQPRSWKAEEALDAIAAVMRAPAPTPDAIRAADDALRAAGLRDTEPLGARWQWFLRQRGLTP